MSSPSSSARRSTPRVAEDHAVFTFVKVAAGGVTPQQAALRTVSGQVTCFNPPMVLKS